MTNHDLDRCLQLLAGQHRRRIIHHLRHEGNETTTLDDLVEQLTIRASDSKNGRQQNREELAIQPQHIHLPTFADNGVVDFDHRSGAVRYHLDEQLETVLDSLPGNVARRIRGHR